MEVTMCQDFDEIEQTLNKAIALLRRVQREINQKKESKIKKEKDLLRTTEENKVDVGDTNTCAHIFYIINHYQKYHPKSMRSVKKNSGIYKKIEGRLIEGYSVEEICKAIDGQHASPFHLGENKSRTEYLQLELVVRSGQKVDMFMSIFDKPKESLVKPKTRRTINAAQEWLRDDEDLRGVQDSQGSIEVQSEPLQKRRAAK
jgi:hypothetical protein